MECSAQKLLSLSYCIYVQCYASASVLFSCEFYWRNGDKSVRTV